MAFQNDSNKVEPRPAANPHLQAAAAKNKDRGRGFADRALAASLPLRLGEMEQVFTSVSTRTPSIYNQGEYFLETTA